MNSTRHQILETAGQLFAERGYELVGINEIIEKAGVAKATFYAHFKSKELLCGAWLQSIATEFAAGNQALLEQKLSVREKVTTRFNGLLEHAKSSEYRGCPFSITASMIRFPHEVRDIIREYKASARSFWYSLCQEVRRDPAEAMLLGDTLFLLYSGAIMEAQNARSLWPIESAKTAALQLIGGI